jgi:hypothetical protein
MKAADIKQSRAFIGLKKYHSIMYEHNVTLRMNYIVSVSIYLRYKFNSSGCNILVS